MRYLVSTVVVLLVFGLPAGSWLYLQSGLNFRLDLVESIKAKEPLDTSIRDFMDIPIKPVFEKRTSLLIDFDKVNNDRISEVLEQYDQAYTFQAVYLSVDSCSIQDSETTKCIQLKSEDIHSILREHTYAIIDTTLNIRNWYSNDDTSYVKIVEHMAVVLPRVPDKDILPK